jgi:hypothetical protein
MATINTGYTFVSGEIVTPSKLNDAVNLAQVSGIVNANISATAGIVDTKLATIATSGKVANTATTSTPANDPGTIVSRDTNGDFEANIITADLDGHATSSDSTDNVNGGAVGKLLYQTAPNTTGFLESGTSGKVLTSAGAGQAPSWETPPGGLLLTVVNFEFTPPTVYSGVASYNSTDGLVIESPECNFVADGPFFYIQVVNNFGASDFIRYGVYLATQIAAHKYKIDINSTGTWSTNLSFRIGYETSLNGGPTMRRDLIGSGTSGYNIPYGRIGLSSMAVMRGQDVYRINATNFYYPPSSEIIDDGDQYVVLITQPFILSIDPNHSGQVIPAVGMTSVVFAS